MLSSNRRLVWLSSSLVSLGFLGALVSGCPDPEGAYNDFAGRLPPPIDAAPVFDSPVLDVIPNVQGTFLVALSNSLLSTPGPGPILFLSTQTVDTSGGSYKVTLSFQPLHATTREPVGAVAVFPEVAVSQTGEFSVALAGELTIPAEANTLGLGAIVTNSVVIHGRITSEDGYCGTVEGNVTQPIMTTLAMLGTTFGAIRVTTTSPPFPTPETTCGTTAAADAGVPDAP